MQICPADTVNHWPADLFRQQSSQETRLVDIKAMEYIEALPVVQPLQFRIYIAHEILYAN